MKTKNLLLGLGIAAGAFLTAAALKKNGKSVKEYVSENIKKVTNLNKDKNNKYSV